ncbi:hypothetical protein BH24ACT22_BH24ACT22_13350 [soil metagenome]
MRTYSHALLTFAAARSLKPDDDSFAVWATAGATIPDVPAAIGAVWLWARRRRYSRTDFLKEVCGRDAFRRPDATLHSALPVALALLLYAAFKIKRHDRREAVLSLLLGWTGHVATDTLTHGSDARPLIWPLSKWRFVSPVSYRERERHGLAFTLTEHAILLMVAARKLVR